MRAFRNTDLHLAVMPKLLQWCDESSFAHWTIAAAAMPSMEEAHQRLRTAGRTSKLNRPSAAHLAGLTVSDGLPRVSLNLQPALRFSDR
jgi:hypothetical protein